MESTNPQPEQRIHHVVFSAQQILAGDFGALGEQFSPIRLSGDRLRTLYGSICLVVQWGERTQDVILIPECRRFFRGLHARHPWLGFFLVEKVPEDFPAPLGPYPFLGLAMCVSDLWLHQNDRTGIVRVWGDSGQVAVFQDGLIFGLRHLGRRARLSSRAIALRELSIRSQIEALPTGPPNLGRD